MAGSASNMRQDAARELARVPWGTDVAEITRVITRDGGIILTGAITRDQVDAINADLDKPFAALDKGNQTFGERKELADFLGFKTKRLAHTLMYSRVLRDEFLGSAILAEYVAAAVPGRAGCHSYLNSQAIEIYPGEKLQDLHRDGVFYQMVGFSADGLNLSVNTILAMMDITEDMGATRVIPGSHLWEDFSVPATPDQASPALLDAGDLLFYNNKMLHSGGANTSDKARRVVTTGFALPYFMGEEAWPFVLPWEEVRHYPKQVQAGVGFRSVSFMGEQPGFLWRINSRPLEEVLDAGLSGRKFEPGPQDQSIALQI